MISDQCFSKEWITQKRGEMGSVNPALLEKSIYGFALLCALGESSMRFVFKGGTSMILLLKEFRRLSIDIDIVTSMPRTEYVSFLADIGRKPPFLGYEPDDRGERGLPHRTHFKFFYDSIISKRPDYVLLDILEEEDLYPKTEVYSVETPFIEMEKIVKVSMPVIDCLLGDKLTAFAPNTIGVHYSQKSSMQIIKQLFDVGELFNAAEDIDLVRKSYQALSEAEIRYRGGKYSQEQAVEDTLHTGVKVCGFGLRGVPRDKHSEILADGISRISSHLVNTRFRLEEAKISASRAVLLTALLKTQPEEDALKKFRWSPHRISELPPLMLKPPLESLNRIKALIPEAFYNLYTAQELLK
jgi:hypothetical protein